MNTLHPVIELAFYKKKSFKYYTNPDAVFVVAELTNGPPCLSLFPSNKKGQSRELVNWFIYDEKCYDNIIFYNQRILKLCVLMIGLFVERDENLIMVAGCFSENILNHEGSFFDTYRELSLKQLDCLISMIHDLIVDKYRVLAYCKQGADIIQDIQNETAGFVLEQFRYRH